MCARFYFPGNPPIRDIFRLFDDSEIEEMPNVAPTMFAPSIFLNDGQESWRMMKWGFVPSWRKADEQVVPLINARCESLAEKPTFREAYKSRRCVLPAGGFYEWKGEGRTKQCHWVGLPNHQSFGLAGVYEEWQGIESFAIVTADSNSQMMEFQPRMPVMLRGGAIEAWLRSEPGPELDYLMQTPDWELDIYPIDSPKNGPRRGGAQASLFE